MARDWASVLAPLVAPVEVLLVDERLTTVTATTALRAAGRSTKQGRAVIDQAAAVALLQGVLDRQPSRDG
jgi:putative Holliday junction resolvase